MKKLNYFSTFQGALKENKITRLLLVGSMVTNIVLAMGMAAQSTTVVLQPPLLMEEGWVARSDASMSMRESWGMYIATLIGNTTPRTVGGLSPALGKITSPEAYSQVMDLLADLQKEVRKEQLEIQFSPSGVFLLPQRDVVAVSGEMRIRSARGVEKKFIRTYELGIAFRNYHPSLTSINFYEGQLKRAVKE